MLLPSVSSYSTPTAVPEIRKKEYKLPSRLNRLNRICVVLALVAPICAQEAKARLYRVDDNVYRGVQPTRQDIANLASSGIHTVLDLRGALDHKGWERQAVEAAGMRYIRIGMSGFFAPSDRQIDKILAVLDDPTLGPIFLHCRRGADRSGVVIACYRITHDHWTNAQAMAEARQQGFSRFEVLMERYIQHFKSASPSAER
jgi:tyrosine-protein phosphatase SIW14